MNSIYKLYIKLINKKTYKFNRLEIQNVQMYT